jgi:hypothetical protein
LNPFTPDYSPVHHKLLEIPALDVVEVLLEKNLDHRLEKKGNMVVTQVLMQWSDLLATLTTWEDYTVLRNKFPTASAWGGGHVTTLVAAESSRR